MINVENEVYWKKKGKLKWEIICLNKKYLSITHFVQK